MTELPVEEQLAAVEARAKQCVACPLAHAHECRVRRGQPALAVGDCRRGPGEQEDATGRPFVGRAGALLDKALRDAGMLRRHVYICNIVKCRACIIENGRAQPPARTG